MENTPAVDEVVAPKKNVLFEVTPTSRVLAVVLFIALPFIGGWIGYTYGSNNSITEVTTNTAPTMSTEVNTPMEASLTTIKQEIFAPGQDQIPGTGEVRNFEALSITVNGKEYIVSHSDGQPLQFIKEYRVSPSGKFVYIQAQRFVGEPEVSVYIHDATTKTLYTLAIADMIGDDEFVYPNELASIKWLDDDRLYIEPQTAEVAIVSTSSSTPWVLQADL